MIGLVVGEQLARDSGSGGVMVMAIGLRLLELRRIRVASLLPALVITPLLFGLFAR